MAKIAHDHGLVVHLDGARIFNAAVAQGINVKELVASVDSVQMCLSNGLAAPVGSLILGTEDFIAEARRIRKRVGGGMRQAGIIAAPGLIALTEMPKRLIEDHDNAKFLAEQLDTLAGVSVQHPETNIINLWLTGDTNSDAYWLQDQLAKEQIKIMCRSANRIRLVTHFGITHEDVERVFEMIQKHLS
jgi:threonine aldolase